MLCRSKPYSSSFVLYRLLDPSHSCAKLTAAAEGQKQLTPEPCSLKPCPSLMQTCVMENPTAGLELRLCLSYHIKPSRLKSSLSFHTLIVRTRVLCKARQTWLFSDMPIISPTGRFFSLEPHEYIMYPTFCAAVLHNAFPACLNLAPGSLRSLSGLFCPRDKSLLRAAVSASCVAQF